MTVAIVVCGDAPTIAHTVAGATVVAGLCADPGRVLSDVGDADSIVLALHPGEFQFSHLQRALRGLDIDPLGAQIIAVEPGADADTVTVSLHGLIARASAYGGSEPEHAKPVRSRHITRRALLRPPVLEYMAAPMIAPDICAAADGCRACVDVCPQDAYSWHSGRIIFDKDICEPCGRCVTSCPTSAISSPAATPPMLEAQVRSHIARTSGSDGIRFVCSRGELPRETGWIDVEVPCTAMVPGTWLLACIAMGARGAALVACVDSGCPLGLDEHALGAIEFARAILTACDLEPDMVGTRRGTPSMPIASLDVADPFAVNGAASVLLALASATNSLLDVVHNASPVGVVVLDATACTLCAQCATTCPTDALQSAYDGESISITLDAAACVNCHQCLAACPEFKRGAIAVEPRVDSDLLATGRHTLNEGAVLMCERCGEPIAPDTMMTRISDLLGDEFEATIGILSRRCLDCRGQG